MQDFIEHKEALVQIDCTLSNFHLVLIWLRILLRIQIKEGYYGKSIISRC